MTVAELVDAGPLAGAHMYGSGANPVHQVRIVDELGVFADVVPHTAVVLIGAAASGGWAVEMAMRRAWEQAAACVIAPSSALSSGSGEVLAERLGVTLIFVDGDPLVTAVEVASAASRPEAARTQLVARCATRIAEAGASARRVLGVLNAELPGTSVAFLDRYGTRLAGRAAASSGQAPPSSSGQTAPASSAPGALASGPGALASGSGGASAGSGAGPSVAGSAGVASPGPASAGSGAGSGGGGERVLVDLELPGGLGSLVASGAVRSPGWPSVVRTVLGLAVAPLSAWAAGERLVAGREFAVQEALAERLLEIPEALLDTLPDQAQDERQDAEVRETLARAAAMGWAVRGPVSGFVVRPVGWQADPAEHAMVRQLLVGALGAVPVVRRGEGWAGWAEPDPGALAVRLRECAHLLPRPVAAGAGRQVERLGAVGESLLGAEAAAYTARAGAVARADRMGPAELLAALPAGVLRAPAEVVLGPLRAADKDGSLLATLAAVLDGGGALRAAERLGVHRNTVTTRLERIRVAGYDLEDPATRLALHLAVHVSR
ncbi:PucR family transcriptional regulator [Nonomuraea sp. NPDC050790]|uniref:PucR family transcriptional regulator n=1 Tax=Nonomuraea sp. NPDC050790 TaxID=3364371 RepID=UPI0037A0C866